MWTDEEAKALESRMRELIGPPDRQSMIVYLSLVAGFVVGWVALFVR